MEIYMYQMSRSFFDLCPRSLKFNTFHTAFALKSLDSLKSNYILSSDKTRGHS